MGMMKQQPYGGVYANMNFPEWKYVEYPKHIPIGLNQYLIANNPEEEEKILSQLQKEDDDAPAEAINFTSDPEKEILIGRATELGVPINRVWSKAKIKATIEAAEGDFDNLPAEVAPQTSEDTSDEYKEKLIEKAKSLGIPATRVWGVPRLKKTIAEFEDK